MANGTCPLDLPRQLLYDAIGDACQSGDLTRANTIFVNGVHYIFLIGSVEFLEFAQVTGSTVCLYHTPDICICEVVLLPFGLIFYDAFFFVFGHGLGDDVCEVLETDVLKYGCCRAEWSGAHSKVFLPAAPWIVFQILYELWLEWVLVDVTEQGEEIIPVFDGFALEPLLVQMSDSVVFVVIVIDVGGRDALHDVSYLLAYSFDEQMYVIAKQTPCVDIAMTFGCLFFGFVLSTQFSEQHLVWSIFCTSKIHVLSTLTHEDAHKLLIVFVTFEDLLFVHSSQDGMIYACV